MSKKIYIGDQEIGTSSGGGGSVINPSDYVDTSTWDAHEKVIASALVDLKSLEDQIEAFDESIQEQENALLAEVQAVEVAKADASTVYMKSDIDKSDKVVAAALADLNDRVSTLETSSGSGSGSGGSGSYFDPTDVNSSISDISTRVNAIETDYVVSNDISTFVTQSALDSSYNTLDASIKELAGSGGGGSSDSAFVKYTNTSDSTKVGIVSSLRTSAPCTSIGNMAVICGNGTASAEGAFSSGLGVATGKNSGVIGSGTATGMYSFAAGSGSAKAYASFAFGSDCVASGSWSIAIGYKAKATKDCTYAEGYNTTANGSHYYGSSYNNNCHAEGLQTTANGGLGSHVEGCYSTTYGYSSHAEGFQTHANGDYSHTEGYNTSSGGNCSHAEGSNTKTFLNSEHAEGQYNSCSSTGGNTFGSPLNTLSTIGNGASNSSTHNAFEVRQSGDIYIPDVSATGEYYEKPMINLQEKLYALDASIQAVAGGSGGGSSTDLTGYVYVDNNVLKKKESSGPDSSVDSLTIDSIETSSITSVDKNTNEAIIFADGLMFVRSGNITYQIDLASLCEQFGNALP